MMTNSGWCKSILKELLLSPHVLKRERIKDKINSPINMSMAIILEPSLEPSLKCTSHPIKTPLAAPVKKVAANAVRNLPPSNPSRGPIGLMLLHTPDSKNLKYLFWTVNYKLRVFKIKSQSDGKIQAQSHELKTKKHNHFYLGKSLF